MGWWRDAQPDKKRQLQRPDLGQAPTRDQAHHGASECASERASRRRAHGGRPLGAALRFSDRRRANECSSGDTVSLELVEDRDASGGVTEGSAMAKRYHTNNNLKKRCQCKRGTWQTCSHAWVFSFMWKGTPYRGSLGV